jgi:phage-related minor tail protein
MRKEAHLRGAKVKELKSSQDLQLEQLLQKMQKITQETSKAKDSIGGLDRNLQKVLASLGKAIGNSITGKGNSQGDLLKMLPNLLNNLIAGKRETGGPVSASRPYLVGEKGAELFVPHSAGNIVPNHAMSSKPQINLVMHINTPNADSFRKSQNQIMAEAFSMMHKATNNL